MVEISHSSSQTTSEINSVFDTQVGVLCLWDYDAFAHISDWRTWEQELLEEWDIVRHIRLGNLVPVTVNTAGNFHLVARAGTTTNPAILNHRERTYLLYSSEPYRLRSHGLVCLSALEDVGGETPPQNCRLHLPPNEYQVTVHWLRWDHEPGSQTPEGLPTPDALPDFILLINPSEPDTSFRISLETFS